MSVTPQTILEVNKVVKDAMGFMQSMQMPIALNDKALVRFLFSPQNRNSTNNALPNIAEVKRRIVEDSRKGLGKTAVITIKPRYNPRLDLSTPQITNYCDIGGGSTAVPVHAQLDITNKVQATGTFSPALCSPTRPIEQQLADEMQRMFELFNHRLYAFALKELTSKNEDGTWKHIGQSPSRNADFGNAPGKVVNIFKADGETPNVPGVTALQQELENAGILSENGIAFGSELWDSFAKLQKGFLGTNDSGYAYGALRVPFLSNGVFKMNTDLSTALRAQGVNNPFMILMPGAVQLITVAEYIDDILKTNTGDTIKTTIVVPGFGVEADFITKINSCPDGSKFSTWDFLLEVRASIFTVPGCIAKELKDDFAGDANGVMLYSGNCADETFCEQQPFVRFIQGNDAPIQDCQVQETVCDTPQTCSVTISATYNPDGSLLLTANPTTVPPSVVTIYEWQKNANSVGGNNSQVYLAAGDWVNGDVFTLSILASDNCTATATFTADSVFPTLQLLRNGNVLADGSETTESSTVGAGNVTVTINLAAASSADVNISSILVTNNAGVPGGTFTAPTAPFVLASGAPQDIVLTVPRANSGVINFSITVASDDLANETYTVGAKITIV